MMIRNYLKIAWRNLWRQKFHAILNILGLTVALTASLLIFLYVYDEFNYDRFNEHADRIVQVALRSLEQNGEPFLDYYVPPETVQLFSEFPEVESIVRLDKSHAGVLRYGEKLLDAGKQFRQGPLVYATGNFFDVFTYNFLAGDPQTALREKYAMVLTESRAKRYFGEEQALGKTLIFNQEGFYNDQSFTVTGVIEDVPPNTNFPFSAVISYRSREGHFSEKQWGGIFLLLREGAALEDVRAKLPALYRKYFGDQSEFSQQGGFVLRPITAIHFQPPLDRNWIPQDSGGNMQYQVILITMGLLLVMIACINYMNLATARSAGRMREIGVRKVVGAFRSQLIVQHLAESMVIIVIASLLAIILTYYCLPALNQFTDKAIHIAYLSQWPVLLGLIGGAILVGLLSGTYPALYLTAFSPVDMLKRTLETGRKGSRFRSILVVCQFTLSVAMIAFALLVYQQLQYIRQKDLGFDKDSVIIIDNARYLGERKYAFLEEVQRQSQVVTVGSVETFPGRLWGFWQLSFYKRLGEVPAQGEDATAPYYDLNCYYGDAGFVPTMGIELVAGRNFSTDRTTDSSAVLVNDAAVQAFGWEDPLGMPLYNRTWRSYQDENGQWQWSSFIMEWRVIGIIKNFHYMPVQRPINPLIVLPGGGRSAIIRVQPGDTQATLKTIETIWKQFHPNYPFGYLFLDEEFEATYLRDLHFGVLIGFFTALSIFIACLGMLGLAAFTAECRTKEIGIRKAMGASVQDIVFLLCTDTVKWVGIASVIGLPVAFVTIRQWLQNFAYRIDIELPVFFLAGIAALLIAFLSVSTQALRTATSNPVDALRNE